MFLVENSVIGSIIGKGGQTVRKISNETSVVIQVQGRDEVSASESERRVMLTSVSSSFSFSRSMKPPQALGFSSKVNLSNVVLLFCGLSVSQYYSPTIYHKAQRINIVFFAFRTTCRR